MSIVEEFVKNYYVERRNTNSLKWDALEERFGDENLLALWVADMEFKTPECIREDLNSISATHKASRFSSPNLSSNASHFRLLVFLLST